MQIVFFETVFILLIYTWFSFFFDTLSDTDNFIENNRYEHVENKA